MTETWRSWYGYKEDDEFLDSDVPDTDK